MPRWAKGTQYRATKQIFSITSSPCLHVSIGLQCHRARLGYGPQADTPAILVRSVSRTILQDVGSLPIFHRENGETKCNFSFAVDRVGVLISGLSEKNLSE